MLSMKKLITKVLNSITPTRVSPTTTYGSISNNASIRIGDIVVLAFRFTANTTVPAYAEFIKSLPTIKPNEDNSTQFSIWGRLVNSSAITGLIGISAYGNGTTLSNWVQISNGQVVDMIGLYIAK